MKLNKNVSPHFHRQESFATKKYDSFATKIGAMANTK